MGGMGDYNSEITNPEENEEKEKESLLTSINEKIKKISDDFNKQYSSEKDKGIEIKSVSQYYLYPKKDKVERLLTIQIIMIFKKI